MYKTFIGECLIESDSDSDIKDVWKEYKMICNKWLNYNQRITLKQFTKKLEADFTLNPSQTVIYNCKYTQPKIDIFPASSKTNIIINLDL